MSTADKDGAGRLEVIATPIGNLADLSARARAALGAADLIAAEDTRHTLTLLRFIGVAKPLLSLHAHNEARRVPEMLARLARGRGGRAGQRCGHAAPVRSRL